jgi:valyl-tRNA synthetase
MLLHPFMPFITEEIYHNLKDRKDDLCNKIEDDNIHYDTQLLIKGQLLQKAITHLREARAKNNLKPKEEIVLHIQTQQQQAFDSINGILAKQVNAKEIKFVTDAVCNTTVVAIESDKFYIESDKEIDTVALKEELIKDLNYQKGFLESVMKKLGNERFVANAKPEVIASEEKKKADAEARIKTIEESLATL